MLPPAYSMDAAPLSYAAQLQTATDFSGQAMHGPAAGNRVWRIAATIDDQSHYLVAVVAPETVGVATDAVDEPMPAAAETTAPAQGRAQLARFAFAGGWVFLGLALFCMAQSVHLLGPLGGVRLWRPFRLGF